MMAEAGLVSIVLINLWRKEQPKLDLRNRTSRLLTPRPVNFNVRKEGAISETFELGALSPVRSGISRRSFLPPTGSWHD